MVKHDEEEIKAVNDGWVLVWEDKENNRFLDKETGQFSGNNRIRLT